MSLVSLYYLITLLFVICLCVFIFKMLKKRKTQYIDSLTKLPNRLALHKNTQHLFHKAHLAKHSISFIIINIDHLRLMNTMLGHHSVDLLIKQISQRLKNFIQNNIQLYRISGNELLLVAQNSIGQEHYIAQHTLEMMKEPFNIDGKAIYMSCSLGIAHAPQHATSIEQLLNNADISVTQAKNQGRNTYHLFSNEMEYNNINLGRINLLNDLYTAYNNNELVLYYQPKFKLPETRLAGVEVLLRWNHPTEGLLFPKDFISLAEKTGLIIPITYWLIEQCCKQIQDWRLLNFNHFLPISINISNLVFEQDELINITQQLLEKYHIQTGEIVFEITESTAIQNLEKSQAVCKKLLDLGIKLAIDDFGVGYSNFLYLKELDITELKIDSVFLRHTENSPREQIILANMIQLAQQLNLTATVEGVESEQQLNLLKQFNCEMVQGFYLAKPIVAEELEQLYHSR